MEYVDHGFGIVILPHSEGFIAGCTLVIKKLVHLSGAKFHQR